MSKTATIRARIEPDIKRKAEEIMNTLGLNASEAISMFYNQIILRRGIPFQVEIPNEVTKKAIDEARNRKGLKSFDNTDELFDYLRK